ncbi:MAG: LysR substrate-binding domain-containing protein [Shinella sp.]|nr:LysR substrate-binding domain-containing protein [Shinella sp.]
MQRIPSMQALRALESFARHGTVWKAADELNLTRSAISHQLRLLERELGFQIFNRIGTRIELTELGIGYAADIRQALNAITGSASRHAGRGVSGAITVSCTPGFASNWLCNYISHFRDAYPDVRISIVTPRRLDDISNPDVDLFIAFGTGNWPSMQVELLVGVEFAPLCSPVLLNKIGGLNDPDDVRKVCLLHLGDHQDWEHWLALAGVDQSYASTGIVFSDMNLVYAATVSGQGVAIGDRFTCRHAMASGQLVRPFEISINSSRSYYMVVSEAKADNQAVVAFSSWLRSEMLRNDADAHTL